MRRNSLLSLMRGVLLAVAFAAVPALVCGCASEPKPAPPPPGKSEGASAKINHWLAALPPAGTATVYRVGPPDELTIAAPRVKELNGQVVTVRSDGMISLNLAGEIKVAGLTPAEISDLIVQNLGKYYKSDSIDVSVVVSKFKSRTYYVMGQVISPGIKPYTGSDDILKVLAEAKLNEYAWPQNIVIVRPNEDANIKQRVTVNVKEMYETGKTAQNFVIEAGDVVYVPLSPLSETMLQFKKVLYPIIPATSIGMMLGGF